MKKTVLFLFACMLASLGLGAQTIVNVFPERLLQRIEGWGVSLCWWAKEAGSWGEAETDSLVDWLVAPDGLNYNVFRYNIPGGDDPQHRNCRPQHMKGNKGLRAEMKGFKASAVSDYDWTADEAQIRILRKIIARCRHYGKEPIVEAFANTPPWWMTVSGCCAGGRGVRGNLALAKILFDDMRYLQPVVWCDWQYIDSGDQWCLLTCSGNQDRYVPPFHRNKNFFVRSQVTSAIKPGYTIVETTADNVLAALSPDESELVVCLLNQEPSEHIFSINFQPVFGETKATGTFTDHAHNQSPFDCTDLTSLTIPACSIATIKINTGDCRIGGF